jgi:hypothetical protein
MGAAQLRHTSGTMMMCAHEHVWGAVTAWYTHCFICACKHSSSCVTCYHLQQANLQLQQQWHCHAHDMARVPAAASFTCQVELENWVEPNRPLTQAEKERAFIIDNSMFELHPRSGRLQPGATEKVWR